MGEFVAGASTWGPVVIVVGLALLAAAVATKLAMRESRSVQTTVVNVLVAFGALIVVIGLLPMAVGLIQFFFGPPIV